MEFVNDNVIVEDEEEEGEQEGEEFQDSTSSSNSLIDFHVTNRELFEAVAHRNHSALLRLFAGNAHASLLRYWTLKDRWNSWVPREGSGSSSNRTSIRRSLFSHRSQSAGKNANKAAHSTLAELVG
jgi:hypothetical protein